MTTPAVHPFLMRILRGSAPGTLPWLALEDRDWEEIISDAAAHGLTPLLYRWLKASDIGRRLPAMLTDSVEGQFFGVAARNLALAQELVSILRALDAAGVACMPVRGLELAERLYGNITARPMGDLDLLVRKADLPRVAEILRGFGFCQLDRRRGFAEAFSYALVFLKNRLGWVIVEPHWSIAYPPFVERLDMESVWQRAVWGRVAGVETRLLGREDLLLHLCLHLAHPDGTAPLLWVYELDRLVRQDLHLVDWSRFSSIARQAQLDFLVSAVLQTVKAEFDTPIPGHVLDQLSRGPRRSVEKLLAGGSSMDGREELAVFLTLTGVRSRLCYALGLLFPSPQYMRFQSGAIGPAELVSAYVRRCCRLAWAGLRGVARVLR